MAFKKVVVVGGGVLGSQIAYQVAYKGFDVTVWLRSEGSIERAKPKFARWHETYLKDLEATKALIGTGTKLYPRGLVDDFENLTVEKVEELKAQADQAFESLIYELDMAKAMADADLVIESLSEDPKAKIAFYQQMAPLLPEKTVIVTNPLARSFPSRSGLRPATLRPSINKSRYINIINALPAIPSSAPTTVKMKSHCSSERKFPFLTDS